MISFEPWRARASTLLRGTPCFVPNLQRAEQLAWDAAAEVLGEAGDRLTEAGVARAVHEAAPAKSALVLGNSLPIRNFDTWVPPTGTSLHVFSQRGVSGIDGIVSSAAGVASCVSEATAVLVGDVSFLHDINGLQLASQVSSPLIVVVVNNGGGRIFEQLPIARQGREEWLPYFTTPHEASVAGAALDLRVRLQDGEAPFRIYASPSQRPMVEMAARSSRRWFRRMAQPSRTRCFVLGSSKHCNARAFDVAPPARLHGVASELEPGDRACRARTSPAHSGFGRPWQRLAG